MTPGPERDALPVGPLLRLFAVLVDVAATTSRSGAPPADDHGPEPESQDIPFGPRCPPLTRPTGNDRAA